MLSYSKNPNEIKKAIVYSDLLENDENGRKIGFKSEFSSIQDFRHIHLNKNDMEKSSF